VTADWRDLAACRGMDTDIFFNKDRYQEAVTVCRSCPVILRCKEAGKDEQGVWGASAGGAEGHGTRSHYVQGCNHRLCLEANADYHQRWRSA